MIQQVCSRYALYVSVSSTWSSMEWMDERGTYYGIVWYVTTFGRRRDACMRAWCTCAGLGGAVLGWAVRCLCCAVLASLSESNEKKDESTG